MPKKTKKEKIIAEYRKRLKLLQSTSFIHKISSEKKLDQEKPITLEKKVAVDKSFFIGDLKKSITLTFILVALEIFFYFVRIIK